jgi:hypothetical protein
MVKSLSQVRWLRRVRLSIAAPLRRFLREERGDIAPATYLMALIPTLIFIFFAFDVGISKGARLAVEYAAFCGARAAAVQLPKGQTSGAVVTGEAQEAIRRAAAACLASVVKKNGAQPLDSPGAMDPIIDKAEERTQVEIQNASGAPQSSFGHNEVVQVQVTYTHDIGFVFSPLYWGGNRPIKIKATAQAMLQTIK